MNQHVHISLAPGMILLIVVGLVILSMFMSGKNKHRSSLGWWVGLGVLLLVLSGIYTTRNIGARVEERYKDQSYTSRFREDLQSSMGQLKESLQEGMTQLKKGLSDSRDALNAAVASSANPGQKKSGVTVIRNLGTTARTPRTPYVSTVQLKDREQSSKKEQVEQRLYERGMQYIANWVRERMPLRHTPGLSLDLAWLKDNGVFPEPVQFTEQDIPRANTQETDKLYGGSLKL
ncbi:MAG TPA: hypothetical protein PKD72_10415, partial [Gemmatales bacterium]|nr:hypothetical protein [Gemmatales bacterium]